MKSICSVCDDIYTPDTAGTNDVKVVSRNSFMLPWHDGFAHAFHLCPLCSEAVMSLLSKMATISKGSDAYENVERLANGQSPASLDSHTAPLPPLD